MAMAYAARHSIYSVSSCCGHGHGHGYSFGQEWPLRNASSLMPRWPSASLSVSQYPYRTFSSCHFSSFQVIWAQLGKDARASVTKPNKLFITASEDSKGPASLLLELPLVRTIIIVLAIFGILPGLLCGCAQASEAIKASSLGLKVASFLRQTGWPDEAIVFFMAMLPVLELRGAIPVGYWMQLNPVKLSVLSVLGNMVPVPLIILYMEKLAKFLSDRSPTAKKIVDGLFESTKRKSGPIQEFEWLGLMLFVAVPFPGTGAWTGAMAASVLGMPFWEAMSANFFGVVMAGLLVNLLVNLGLKYASLVGIALFLVSTFMWSFLRAMVKIKH